MPCHVDVVSNALLDLWMNRETPLLSALAYHLQRFVTAVHVEVPDFQTRDLRATEADLETHRQDCPIAYPKQGVRVWCIPDRSRLLLGKCECRAFPAIDGRPLHFAHRVHGDNPKLREMRKETRQRGEPP